jgi:amidase
MDTYPGREVHPDCSEAARAAGRLLERLGHNVEASHPAALVKMEPMQSILNVISASQARGVEWLGQAVGREIRPDDLDSDNWLVSELGKGVSATQYLGALEFYNHFSRAMASWWAGGFDILITPTITRPSPRIGEFVPDPAKPLDAFTCSGAILAFCIPFNITGQPAVSLPLHWNGEGLPIGVQFIAAMSREDLLFRLAAQLEGEVRWSERRPPIHAAA